MFVGSGIEVIPAKRFTIVKDLVVNPNEILVHGFIVNSLTWFP
jgi:hypothetical protein